MSLFYDFYDEARADQIVNEILARKRKATQMSKLVRLEDGSIVKVTATEAVSREEIEAGLRDARQLVEVKEAELAAYDALVAEEKATDEAADVQPAETPVEGRPVDAEAPQPQVSPEQPAPPNIIALG